VPNKLFLSFIRPHKPVTSSTLARWIKNILQLAGIDTSIFTAHLVRGVSTSEAFNQGVSIPEILSMASWSRSSTFQKFYYRPQFNSSPGKAVLSGGKDMLN
jgi:site-specific recombinase XerD